MGAIALALGIVLLEHAGAALGAPAPASAVESPPAWRAAVSPTIPEARADDDRPANVASYTLHARLDAEAHRVDGQETLVFVNRCTALSLGPGDLWPRHTRGVPDEPDDETDVRLPLPSAIAPGDSLTLTLEFSAKLPSVVLRTGYAGDFHFVAQWFPKLARLEPDGTFAHFPFHAQAEFYADFGDYDVTLDVPERAVVAASGQRTSVERHGERKSEHYRAESVHDFAWAAWPGFDERTRRIDGVEVRILFPPGNERNATRTLDTLAFVLPRASALYGRYPYATLGVVHPPAQAGESGGMEYPTLIATGGPWYSGLFGDRGIESITTHELLHQWFYGLLASNEARSEATEGMAARDSLDIQH